MAVTKSFKVGTTAVGSPVDSVASFTYIINGNNSGTTYTDDTFCFSNRNDVIEGVLLNTWTPCLLITDAAMTTIRYASKNTVYSAYSAPNHKVILTDGASTDINLPAAINLTALDSTTIKPGNCIIRFDWADTPATTLTKGKFYSYNGSSVLTAPASTYTVAFEAATSLSAHVGINFSTAAYPAAQNALAWTYPSQGVGGRANALALVDQTSNVQHTYYLSFSVLPTAYGSSTFGWVVEFDVS